MKKLLCAIFLVISNFAYAEVWEFDAVLNDKVIGQHTFIYEDEKTVSDANFKFEYLLWILSININLLKLGKVIV